MAVPLTPLASSRSLLEDVASLWKVRALACAEKQVGGSRPTSWCVTWTMLHLIHVMVVDLRSLLMACPFRGCAICRGHHIGVSSPLHCDGTPTPRAADSDGAALVRARRRKERTYPELVHPRAGKTRGDVRSQEDGLMRLAVSLGCLRALGRGTRPSSCVAEWSKHGGSGGGPCCLSLLPEPLCLLCWACGSSRGSDGVSPLSDEVVRDHRCAGLGWVSLHGILMSFDVSCFEFAVSLKKKGGTQRGAEQG